MNREEEQIYQEKMGSPEMEYLQYLMENPNFSLKCGCSINPETDHCFTHNQGHAYCHSNL